MRLAIVGCTGMVGRVMLELIEERDFQYSDLLLVASERSVGKKITFRNHTHNIIDLEQAIEKKPDLALFSAGGSISKQWAPKFSEMGCRVIDNSSAWRMDASKKLIVPEINGHLLTKEDFIIANPNCSTIQLVMAIWPIHQMYTIQRMIVSTYQSVTGTGQAAVHQLQQESLNQEAEKVYPHPIHQNAIPQCDEFLDNGYTKEEMKIINETHKILSDPSISITSTAVRIPVIGGHSESVNLELKKDFEISGIKNLLSRMSGVIVSDNPKENQYPMPLMAHGNDFVYVGRIRRDFSRPNALNIWVVSDNLRKGAATNTVQIAEWLLKKGILESQSIRQETSN
ncbi:MAG: aspartate-semialdehyde dehydrogenase [Flavobacteriaceae bacterium]|nr:aspartate-semialdehyde dehydrogenase [Flavobacteriaceae bacterium]MCY4267627.1 aspartate-semialdehyde dehydrogenase [Flavobacteriaceae bacterium]MCY4298011.1 aspartate-semialdehyde dehydrogenase [Flavobacteriaceae bacterium]